MVFVNFPKHVPTDTSFSLETCAANFRIFSLRTDDKARKWICVTRHSCEPLNASFRVLPHVVHAVVVQSETVGAIRSVHKYFDVFSDAVGVERTCITHTRAG